MARRRTTPLRNTSLQTHQCSIELRLEKLRMIPLFNTLDKEDLIAINQQFSTMHYTSGEFIAYEGEPSSYFRVVIYGAVKLTRYIEKGKELMVDMLKPGEYFGSLSSDQQEAHYYSATAQTDCCILSIPKRDFRRLLKEYSSLTLSVLDLATQRLHKARERMQHLSHLPVKDRILCILKELADKFGESHSAYGVLIQLPLSRKDLADLAGTSAETASRIISDLQDEGKVTSGRQWIAVTDPDHLS